MVTKVILRAIVLASCLLPFFVGSIHAADYPLPFSQMKEVVVAQGEKADDGTFVLQKRVTGVEYWMIYFPSDGSVAFGKATNSGSYSWGILYNLEGKSLFLETFLGQIVNLYYVESEGAIELGRQFVMDLQGPDDRPPAEPTKANWIII